MCILKYDISYTQWLIQLATSVIFPFGCSLCCKALEPVLVDLDFAAVPFPSSNVPFPMHDLEGCSIFTLDNIMEQVSFIILVDFDCADIQHI
jgi:hypothetical protein